MFGMSETPYDLRFQMLGIPVRVHPMFWLVSIMLAGNARDLSVIFLWVLCVFVSVLVHEFGHGLAAKSFGARPSIALVGMFGLCIYNEDRQTPQQRLAVLISGPGAGFIFGFVVMLFYTAAFGVTFLEHLSILRVFAGLNPDPHEIGGLIQKLGMTGTKSINFRLYWDLIYINLMWGLVNLLPIFPLDGGRISEILLSYLNPYSGKRWGHIVSLLVAGLLAVVTFATSSDGDYFRPLFFAAFAFINYQLLQSIHKAQIYGIYDEDSWRH